jgi:hypothetical protein
MPPTSTYDLTYDLYLYSSRIFYYYYYYYYDDFILIQIGYLVTVRPFDIDIDYNIIILIAHSTHKLKLRD